MTPHVAPGIGAGLLASVDELEALAHVEALLLAPAGLVLRRTGHHAAGLDLLVLLANCRRGRGDALAGAGRVVPAVVQADADLLAGLGGRRHGVHDRAGPGV